MPKLFILSLLALPLFGQTVSLTQTTTSAAVTALDKAICVTSTAGITVPRSGILGDTLYLDQEPVIIRSITDLDKKCYNVTRSNRPVGHASGTLVYAGAGSSFYLYPASGTCVVSSVEVRPWIDILGGVVYDCIGGMWTRTPVAVTAGADGKVVLAGPLVVGTGMPAGAPAGSIAVGGNVYGSGIGLDAGLGNDTCFMGDSITADSGSTFYQGAAPYYLGSGWVNQLPILSSQQVYSADPRENFGVGGNTTAQMIARQADVLTAPCRRVIILGGTNDLGTLTAAQIGANLLEMYQYYRAHGLQPIAATVPPKTSAVAAAQQANIVIRSLANQYRVPLIDFYAALAGTAGVYQPAYNSDGTHPNSTGYRVMAQAAIAQIGSLFGPPTVWLPTTTTDGINLAVNPLMGTCASGVPASWGNSYGTGPSPATTCVADAAIAGQWFQNVFTGAAGNSGQYYIIGESGVPTTWTQGDTLLLVGRIQVTGLEATGGTIDIKLGSTQGTAIFHYASDIVNGVFAFKLTAPATSSTLSPAFQMNFGATAGAVTIKFAQVGFIDLTALGAQ